MVKLVETLLLPELTSEQIENLCSTVENAAIEHVFSRVSSKIMETLNISVEAEGAKPLDITIDVEAALSLQTKSVALTKLVDDAAKEALKAGEDYLRTLK